LIAVGVGRKAITPVEKTKELVMRNRFIGNSYERASMVEVFGGKIIDALDKQCPQATNRIMDGVDEIVEFASSVIAINDLGERCILIAYYYQHDPIEVDDLADLEWEIDDYSYDYL